MCREFQSRRERLRLLPSGILLDSSNPGSLHFPTLWEQRQDMFRELQPGWPAITPKNKTLGIGRTLDTLPLCHPRSGYFQTSAIDGNWTQYGNRIHHAQRQPHPRESIPSRIGCLLSCAGVLAGIQAFLARQSNLSGPALHWICTQMLQQRLRLTIVRIELQHTLYVFARIFLLSSYAEHHR